MYYCPRCKAEVPIEAHYCQRCGFNATNARLKSLKVASPSLPNNAGPQVPATPPVISPPAPIAALKAPTGHTNLSIPSRPVSTYSQQSSQKLITPTHLLALQPSMPSTPSAPMVPQTPQFQQAQQISSERGQQNVSQSSPMQHMGPQHIVSTTMGSAESYVATSNAAEQWRTSWRNKQRAEAGPATEVSRGHSSVPEPLMAMQNSLIRIRAITWSQQKKNRISIFWVSTVLMSCLIIGLGVFILSTYSGSSGASDTIYTPPTIAPPSLSAKGSQGATIQVGQMLHVHGDNFNVGDPIIFLLDGANSISGTNGREIAIQVSNAGTFDVNLPVATSWTNGPHVIEAEDNQTGQTAYLSIQVGPTTLTSTNTIRGLSLSQSHLKFLAYIGQSNPKEQFITLTNTGNVPLTWTAKATTDNSLNWLTVDTTTTSGTINAGRTASVGIKAIIGTLKNSALTYTGDILFSINGQAQLIVPVTLLVQSSAEWIFSPNPVIGVLSLQGGTCKPDSTLSFINLGSVPVYWHILLSGSATSYVQFMMNGKPHMQGMLAPSGQNGDMQVLTLVCNNIQIGATYPFTIDANNTLWNDSVFIQAS